MIIDDKKIYRNLQEQVGYLTDQVAAYKDVQFTLDNFGIEVLGIVETESDIPSKDFKPGDAYLVGYGEPYDLYINTRVRERSDGEYDMMFVNMGPLNVVGPAGPMGSVGPAGSKGDRGTMIYTGSASPASLPTTDYVEGDLYIRITALATSYTGDVYKFIDMTWTKIGNIRGPKGDVGATGPAGIAGPIGETGPKGDKGDPGQSFVIMGTITDTAQLPDPTTAPRNEAYVLKTNDNNRMYFITGAVGSEQWSYIELGNVGTTITQDNGVHKIDTMDISELVPDGLQIIGTDCFADNDMGLVVTGTAFASVRGESKETENAGAYSIPIQDSATIKIDVANSKFTLNLDGELVSKIDKALVIPTVAPTSTKVVAVDTANAQTMILIDDAPVENSANLVTSGGVYEAIANAGGGGSSGGGSSDIITEIVVNSSTNTLGMSFINWLIANKSNITGIEIPEASLSTLSIVCKKAVINLTDMTSEITDSGITLFGSRITGLLKKIEGLKNVVNTTNDIVFNVPDIYISAPSSTINWSAVIDNTQLTFKYISSTFGQVIFSTFGCSPFYNQNNGTITFTPGANKAMSVSSNTKLNTIFNPVYSSTGEYIIKVHSKTELPALQ